MANGGDSGSGGGGGQHEFEHGDDFRVQDVKSSGQQIPKGDAKNISGDHPEISQPVSGKVTDYIKKYDPQNSSGADPKQLDILDKLLKKGNQSLASLKGMIGAGNMSSEAAQNNSNPQQSQSLCPPGFRFDVRQQKCVLDCPQGQVWDDTLHNCRLDCPQGQHWDYTLNKCVDDLVSDNSGYNPDIDSSTGFPSLIT